MRKSSNEHMNIESFDGKVKASLNKHREAIQKQAEIILSHSGATIARMSTDDIQNLLFDLQTHQIELKMQNEELNRAHQELTASRDNYAQLYDSSPVVYLTLNEAGIIQNVNIAATVLLNCPKDQLINQKLGNFIHPSEQDNYYLFFRSLLSQKTGLVLNTLLRNMDDSRPLSQCPQSQTYADLTHFPQPSNKSNPLTYVECSASVINSDNNTLRIFLIINNITERKQAQETIARLNAKLEEKVRKQTSELTETNLSLIKKVDELHRSKHQLLEREAKLNSIFNASVEGIITVDTSDIIVSANAAVETIFGYKPEELLGCSINKLMSPSPTATNDCSLTGAAKYDVQIQELEGIHKNGSAVPLDLSIAEHSIDNEHFLTAIVRDVSVRKHREHQDKQHLDELDGSTPSAPSDATAATAPVVMYCR